MCWRHGVPLCFDLLGTLLRVLLIQLSLLQMHCADINHCLGDLFNATHSLRQSVSGGHAEGLESKAWTKSNQNASNDFKGIGTVLDRQCLHFWGD